MHATVTTSVKLRRRNRRPSGAAKPHIPGFRRPQIKHTDASALVSRPQLGHMMEPDVLRNIVLVASRLGNAVSLVEPDAEVDEPAGERAKRPVWIAIPRGPRAACRTCHATLRRHRSHGTGGRQSVSTQ